MDIRESLLEQLAGNLEYHPRRAAVYLALAVAAACFWGFASEETRFTTVPLVFLLGSVALLVKGIFLLRRSSEGLGLSQQELDDLAQSGSRKRLPPLPEQAAQILQDFGAGGLLLWPVLAVGKDIDQSRNDPPRLTVFAYGAALFGLGWLIRRFTRPAQT